MRIDVFDVRGADHGSLVGYYELAAAVAAVDRPDDPAPTFDSAVGRLRVPLSGQGPATYWAAHEAGRLVGFATLALPDRDNLTHAKVDVVVHPDRRRRGVGTRLLDAVLPAVRAGGRPVVEAWTLKGTPGDHWVGRLGFRLVLENAHQMLPVTAGEPLPAPLPPPPEFRLVSWLGSTPAELVESYAAARTAIEDAPTGRASNRPEAWTVERVRQAEEDLRRQEVEQRVVAAVHQPTRTVSGFTELEVYPHRPEFGYQGDTAVLAAYRGRRLGLSMKTHMLRWLRTERPALDRVYTSSAAGNEHMLRVNREIGFTVFRTVREYEHPVPTLTATRAGR